MNDFRRIWQGACKAAAMDCWKAGFCGGLSLVFGDLMLCQPGWLVMWG